MQDVRSYRHRSVHHLLRAKLKIRVTENVKRKGVQRVWNLHQIKRNEKKKKYKENRKVRIEGNGKRDTIEKEWTSLRNTIIEAADVVIGRKERETQKDWFDQECNLAIENKDTEKEEKRKTGRKYDG
ncbi:hypothetical protein QE152_g17061 [Popillia japonica]|uniref:Uncharacterized protein n=1 Tax=Popillia japonica TaxID=7064 RepID=A0AAW1L2D8_POPJA